jgi:hypothetical protein
MVFSTDSAEFVREAFGIEIETAGRKVIITVEAQSQDMADAFAGSVEILAHAFRVQANSPPAETISSIAAVMLAKAPVSSTLLREAKMLAQAKSEILQSQDWVTSNEIATLANFSNSTSSSSSQPNKWKQAGKIFALNHEGVDYFPLYGLDPANGFSPYAALASVIYVLDSMKDGWGMAFWFASPNIFLRGKLPKDALADIPSRVLLAAKEEVLGVVHG